MWIPRFRSGFPRACASTSGNDFPRMISITIEGLVKRFGDTVALNGVSLRIEPGELFFLLGPSGCGKTTLLRSVAGFAMPDEGRILFGEENVTDLPAHERHTGMMFQSYALWPHLTVAENVAFGLQERRVPKAQIADRVAEALRSVHMGGHGHRRIGQLSGGQQQRVALARALVVRPRALLLDEPLSNLDAKLRMEMRGEIRRVCHEAKLTALYVTHDQKEALSISDRMAVLDHGEIAQIGTPEEVYRRPRTRTVADFIGETNFLPGKVRALARERVSVETALGMFEGVPGDPAWKPDPGSEVLLSIRPECWRLQNDAKTVNCVRGRIGESVYLGELAQHEFRHGETVLKVFELNPKLSTRSADQDVLAHVRSEDVVILRPDPHP